MMKNIAVLVSGGGTNLQALIDAQAKGEIIGGKITLVVSSNPDAYALERAKKNNIATEICEKKMVLLSGTFLAPLRCGEKAVFTYNGQVMRTSTVLNIQEITADYIKFETRNSIYLVRHQNLPPAPACA